jgi:hypothetical protein
MDRPPIGVDRDGPQEHVQSPPDLQQVQQLLTVQVGAVRPDHSTGSSSRKNQRAVRPVEQPPPVHHSATAQVISVSGSAVSTACSTTTPLTNDDKHDRLGSHRHTYYRRLLVLGGRRLVFWIYAPLIWPGKDDEAIVDFVFFPFET